MRLVLDFIETLFAQVKKIMGAAFYAKFSAVAEVHESLHQLLAIFCDLHCEHEV